MRSETYARSPEIKWVYKTKEEALHKGSGINETSLDRVGYKLMKRYRDWEKDQYVIEKFNGDKDIIYKAIEKELKPLVRDKILTDLLEN